MGNRLIDVDPRVSLNLMVFADASLEDAVGFARELGVQRIGVPNWTLEAAGWNRGLDVIRDCGMTVSTIIHPSMFQLENEVGWEQSRALLMRSLEAAATVGAETVYTTTGPAGRLTWEEAADALTEAVAPVVEHAVSIGVPLIIETTNPLRIPAQFRAPARRCCAPRRTDGTRAVRRHLRVLDRAGAAADD